MNQPPLDRAAFLRTLRRCHTEEQLFSRLTFACLAQYDEAQRPELLDDVRGAAYSLRLPAVEYKTDQWLHRCQDAIDTDRAAFLAADPDRSVSALAAAVCAMGLAGEIAWGHMAPYDGNATYRNRIIDAVCHLDGETLSKGARYELR